MDIRQLRYFLAVAEERSFSRAAKRLHVAQPALSLHVRKMEEVFGTPLLIRGASGATPTEAGVILMRRARSVISDFDHMTEDMCQLGREPSGIVRIGLPGTISGILSVPLIAAIHEQYPQIKLIIAEAMSGFVGEWLDDGRADLGVLYGDTGSKQIALQPLIEEELVLLQPPGSTPNAKVDAELLTSLSLILPSGTHGLRRTISDLLLAAGTIIEPTIEIDSYTSIKRLVSDGYGCSVLPSHTVGDEAANGALVVTPFSGRRLWRQVYLATPTNRTASRATTVVTELLSDTVRNLLASQTWHGTRKFKL